MLIIHQFKTKEMITVTMVWNVILISIYFYYFISLFTIQFQFRLKRYTKRERQCFITFPNTSNFVNNTPLRVVFSTLLSCDETLHSKVNKTETLSYSKKVRKPIQLITCASSEARHKSRFASCFLLVPAAKRGTSLGLPRVFLICVAFFSHLM